MDIIQEIEKEIAKSKLSGLNKAIVYTILSRVKSSVEVPCEKTELSPGAFLEVIRDMNNPKEQVPEQQDGLREELAELCNNIMINEDTDYDDAESVAIKLCQILVVNPQFSKPVEPLAVLAKRKGLEVWPMPARIDGENVIHHLIRKQIGESTFESTIYEAESKARAYLNGLSDTGEDKGGSI